MDFDLLALPLLSTIDTPNARREVASALLIGRIPMDRRRTSEESLELAAEDKRAALPRSKFEVWGEEMIEKEVKQSGNSGRVYLPPEWIGKHVKIIRIE